MTVAVPRASRVMDGVRARVGAPSIGQDVVAEVLGRCGLRATGRARDLGGRRSRNVVVPTDAGPKVVKRYRAGWAPETVAYGHSVLGRLAEVGFAAPRPVRAGDGETAIAVGENRYAVFDLLPGRTYASTHLRHGERVRLMALAGVTLARWHAALDGFDPEGRHHLGFVGWEGPRARGLDWYRTTVETLRHDRVGSARLVAEGPVLLERIEARDAALTRLDLPRALIHGDFGLHNLLIRGGEAAVVDVELARIDLRLTDLLLVLGKHLDGGEPDPEVLGAFFAGYGPVDERERAAVGEAWRYQCATSAVRSWLSARTADDPSARVAAALRSLDRADWVDAHPDVVGRWFGAGAVSATHA